MRLICVLLLAIFVASTIAYKDDRTFKNSNVQIRDDEVIFNTDKSTVSFIALGDWGGQPTFPYRTIIEKAVSEEMTFMANLHQTLFQLALGDNFYFSGVKNADDKRFNETYQSVFDSPVLENTPWFFLLGNHDHYGNASAQLEYTKRSERWILPSYNYTIDIFANETNLIKVLMIDTILLCGNTDDFDATKQPIFESMMHKQRADEYFNSIASQLREIGESDVPYIIVAGHFPVWSIAEHGPTQCLIDKIRPLLHKYKVSAYFCGHDHNLQHISDTYLNATVEYILTGASNFADNSTVHQNAIPPNSLKFHWADDAGLLATHGGFCVVKATSQNMTITYVESNGKELYQTVILPRSFN